MASRRAKPERRSIRCDRERNSRSLSNGSTSYRQAPKGRSRSASQTAPRSDSENSKPATTCRLRCRRRFPAGRIWRLNCIASWRRIGCAASGSRLRPKCSPPYKSGAGSRLSHCDLATSSNALSNGTANARSASTRGAIDVPRVLADLAFAVPLLSGLLHVARSQWLKRVPAPDLYAGEHFGRSLEPLAAQPIRRQLAMQFSLQILPAGNRLQQRKRQVVAGLEFSESERGAVCDA